MTPAPHAPANSPIPHPVRGHRLLISIGFFAFLIGGAMLDQLLWPLPEVKLLGAEAVEATNRSESARLGDGTTFRIWEEASLRNSRLRSGIQPPWAAVLLGFFGEANERVLVAKDGWLFLRERLTRGEGPRDTVVARPAATLSAAVRRLQSAGLRVLILPIPTKATMVRESLPDDAPVDPGAYPALIASLRDRGLAAIDLLELWDAEPELQAYCRTDTHWSYEGAIRAAAAVAKELGLLVEGRKHTDLARIETEDALQMLTFLGMGGAEARADAKAILRLTGFTRMLTRPQLPPTEPDSPWEADESAPVLHVGTSFSTWPDFAAYLGYFSDRRIQVTAFAGGGPFGSMGVELMRVRDGQRRSVPRTLVWEIPSYSLIVPRWLHWSEHIWRLLPATGFEAIEPAPPFRGSLTTGQLRVTGTVSCSIPEGQVFHHGNGELAIRLRGSLSGGSLRVVLWCGNEAATALWFPGDTELVVPLLQTDFGGHAVNLFLNSESGAPIDLNLQSVQLTTDLDSAAGLAANRTDRSIVRWDAPPLLRLHSALRVRCEGPMSPGTVFQVETTHGKRQVALPKEAAPGAVLLISLVPQSPDERLRSLTSTSAEFGGAHIEFLTSRGAR
ncbi:MAG TPA: hypothetical protein PKA37_02200 [Planctomycetota bacterium]|nr:hypothetical protein [Planctomycetota bacterium]